MLTLGEIGLAILDRTKMPAQRIEIDLSGSQGNAFYLLGLAERISDQIGIDSKPIIEEMMSGDYENLIQVFDDNFGDFVDLIR